MANSVNAGAEEEVMPDIQVDCGVPIRGLAVPTREQAERLWDAVETYGSLEPQERGYINIMNAFLAVSEEGVTLQVCAQVELGDAVVEPEAQSVSVYIVHCVERVKRLTQELVRGMGADPADDNIRISIQPVGEEVSDDDSDENTSDDNDSYLGGSGSDTEGHDV